MKELLFLIIAVISFVCFSGDLKAATLSKIYTVSVTMPTAVSVGLSTLKLNSLSFKIPSGIGPFAAGLSSQAAVSGGVALSFDPLHFDNANKIWLPDNFFSIDIGPAGGPGSTDVVLTYNEGSNPNAPGHGLGWKTTATFMRATLSGSNTVEAPLSAHGPKKMLKDLNGEHITPDEITSSGWLRIYIGVVTKDPGATFVDPSNSEVISNADHSGYYDGSLVITATVS